MPLAINSCLTRTCLHTRLHHTCPGLEPWLPYLPHANMGQQNKPCWDRTRGGRYGHVFGTTHGMLMGSFLFGTLLMD